MAIEGRYPDEREPGMVQEATEERSEGGETSNCDADAWFDS
jgi:hypothetical protein